MRFRIVLPDLSGLVSKVEKGIEIYEVNRPVLRVAVPLIGGIVLLAFVFFFAQSFTAAIAKGVQPVQPVESSSTSMFSSALMPLLSLFPMLIVVSVLMGLITTMFGRGLR